MRLGQRGIEGAVPRRGEHKPLNYRHAFHAGNFADLVKHAGLLALVARLTAAPGPLTVCSPLAGRGRSYLAGPVSRLPGYADAGTVRLLAAHPPPGGGAEDG